MRRYALAQPLSQARIMKPGPWQRCDPRARLLFTVVCSGIILAAQTASSLLPGVAALIAIHLASGSSPRSALFALRPFRFLLVFTAAMQLFFTPGDPALPGILPAFITQEGLTAAILAPTRLAGVIIASAHLVATTSPLELARSLGWVLIPTAAIGVPVRDITLIMALGFQFFPILLDEGLQVRAAMESRGISLTHVRPRLRLRAVLVWTLAVLFGMVDRSSRLASAMEAKGFGLNRRRHHRFTPWTRESTLLITSAIILIIIRILL